MKLVLIMTLVGESVVVDVSFIESFSGDVNDDDGWSFFSPSLFFSFIISASAATVVVMVDKVVVIEAGVLVSSSSLDTS